ncbi:MAG: hypothetical protein H0W72_16875, partial [Planctomycetes bacterium]|nr:hypothetical protein [Planctomycetota bacterium]
MIRSILIIALALFAGVASAAEAAAVTSAKAGVAKYDTNKDSSLSKDEIAAIKDEKERAQITALDKDLDGAISTDEIKSAGQAPKHDEAAGEAAAAAVTSAKAGVAKYDTNKDSSLSKDEIAAIKDEKERAQITAL